MSENNPKDIFSPDSPVGKSIYEWWKAVKENSGDRAVLKRARSPLEIAMQPVYYRLLGRFQELKSKGHLSYFSEEALMQMAGLLAHVDENINGSVAAQMKPVVSDLRFRRILRMENRDDEFYTAMIRFLRMLKGKANIHDLAKSIFYWNDRTRRQWASQYYLAQEYEQPAIEEEKIAE